MSKVDTPGWEQITGEEGTLVGESWGVRWGDHHLEVFTIGAAWYWSMTHPIGCRATRGDGGKATSRKQAESRAIGAAERCKDFEK